MTRHLHGVPSTPPQIIKVSGHDGVLAAVPFLLGFHPEESLLVLTLTSLDPQHLGPVSRIDLPEPPEIKAAAQQMIRPLAPQAKGVIVVGYSDRPHVRRAVELLRLQAAGLGMRIVLAAWVSGGVARFLPEGNGYQHPPVPVPTSGHPVAQKLSAAHVLAGRSVMPDRESLRTSIVGPRIPDDDAVRPAMEALDLLRTASPECIAAEAMAIARRALGEWTEDHCVRLDTATRLAVLVQEIEARDELIAEVMGPHHRSWLAMLISAVGLVPDPLAAELCSVLALVAYRAGDGALAQIAVDRCLATDPDHRLSHLLIDLMACCLPPEDLGRLMKAGAGTPRPRASKDAKDEPPR